MLPFVVISHTVREHSKMHTYQTNVEMKKLSPITVVKDCFLTEHFQHAYRWLSSRISAQSTKYWNTKQVTSHPTTTAFQSLAFWTVATVSQLTHNLHSTVYPTTNWSTQTLMLQQSQLSATSDNKQQYLTAHAILIDSKTKVTKRTAVHLTGNRS
jgi:hypothetical protein